MAEVINISWRQGAYYVSKPNWDGGAVVPHTDHVTDIQQAREQALRDAAKAMCRHCCGTRGYLMVPVKADGAWWHRAILGTETIPCGAGPVWHLLGDWIGEEERLDGTAL